MAQQRVWHLVNVARLASMAWLYQRKIWLVDRFNRHDTARVAHGRVAREGVGVTRVPRMWRVWCVRESKSHVCFSM